MASISGAFLLLCLSLPAQTGDEAPTIALRGGTVLTVSNGTIEGGTVVMSGGKITAVGKDVAIPEGATVVDVSGKFVMPGIVDTHSHMGVYSWPGGRANADGNEATDPITPHVRAEDSVNVEDPAFERALAGGVTTIQIIPGSANLIGGQGVVVKLRLGETLDGMKFEGAPRGIKMAFGENPKRVYGGRSKMPSTRMGNAYTMRKAFVEAQDYGRKWKDYEERKAEGEDEGPPPARDLKLEVLRDVLDGKIRVHIHCYRQDGILKLIEISKEFGFHIASFQHCLEGYKVAEQIAANKSGVATFADWWGYKVEAWDAVPHNAAILASKGVRVAIHSDSSDLIQRLYHEAAKAVKYGLSEEEGLKSITLHPAWMLGIDDRVGSIEVGKDADIAVLSKHPYDIYTRVEKTYLDGRLAYELQE
ncbi:MAG: amidohydrolase [Planctomycetota bacterium]|nr:amidohydrolase [Planctomycetota bacterium]